MAIDSKQTPEARASLNANCTHVKGNYWIFEGDDFALESCGVIFTVLAQGIVDALGGLSESELINVCRESFGIDESLFV